jgi:tRNA modification GTPase
VYESDTITAIATAPGESALAIVRVSGRDAVAIADRVFRGRAPLADAQGFTVHYGQAVNMAGEAIDEVLATLFRSPHSYTGEDAVEFSCHGGMVVTASVLDALLGAGARSAAPGEFTRRAFLNGRIDLSQAEAVADLITARSARAQRASLEQLSGRLGARVGALRRELLDLCALLELDLDFAEEGLEIVGRPEIGERLGTAAAHIRHLASTYKEGRLYRDGVAVVFAGRPNAGKSSLFNALLKEERAIVTAIPGTTRDYLEESVSFDGVRFRLIDTAGIRESQDVVEQVGVARARNAVRTADIVVIVVDPMETTSLTAMIDDVKSNAPEQKVVLALNKSDLVKERDAGRSDRVAEIHGVHGVRLSALTGDGVHELRSELVALATSGVLHDEHEVLITNRRHQESLLRSAECLDRAKGSLEEGATNEFIALDLRDGANALSEITGEMTTEEILNAIFARFCVGK